jgi:hypothetical protein
MQFLCFRLGNHPQYFKFPMGQVFLALGEIAIKILAIRQERSALCEDQFNWRASFFLCTQKMNAGIEYTLSQNGNPAETVS